jgi:hypothetical protein
MDSLEDTMEYLSNGDGINEIIGQPSAKAAAEAGMSPHLVHWLQQTQMFDMYTSSSRRNNSALRAKNEVELLKALQKTYKLLE